MNSVENHDTVKYQLNIRAPIKSQIYGAILGSIVGTTMHSIGWYSKLTDMFNHTFYIGIISSALLAAVLVVAFARKKDAQPFITVEDFWEASSLVFLPDMLVSRCLIHFYPKHRLL
jgi:hypothetical protein